jgi:ATP-dependent DNA helicase PIF1
LGIGWDFIHAPSPYQSSPYQSSPSYKMNAEQQAVFDFIRKNHNQSVLITGPAGTGKTYLTKAILKWLLHECHPPIPVGITGSTGNAAVLIQGRTLHSYLGIGLAKSPPEQLVKSMNAKNIAKLRRLHTLILDEVSMISAELMDIIDAVLRIVRKKDRPFGNVRCVFIGDACQLPPVCGGYFFKAAAWEAANITVFQLTTLVRQQSDTRFQELLSRARWGNLNAEDIALLKSRVGAAACAPDVKPTRLYAVNVNVDKENDKSFNELLLTIPSKDQVHTYKTDYYDPLGSVATQLKMKKYAQQARIPEEILLCIGAQVMITWNQAPETGIVNGTRGVICELQEDCVGIRLVSGATAMIPYMRLDYPDESPKVFTKADASALPYIQFMPIRLAYALSIHKSQGITLDAAEIDLGDSIFEYGQAYTALSRVKSLDALRLTAFSRRVFRTHPDVVAFYKTEE